MPRYNIRKRDGLARTGLSRHGTTTIKLPAAADCEELFPALKEERCTNIPLSAPATLVQQYSPSNNDQPVSIHPRLDNPAQSGDCVMVAGWHTAYANPRTYVDWLCGSQREDTRRYGMVCPGCGPAINSRDPLLFRV